MEHVAYSEQPTPRESIDPMSSTCYSPPLLPQGPPPHPWRSLLFRIAGRGAQEISYPRSRQTVSKVIGVCLAVPFFGVFALAVTVGVFGTFWGIVSVIAATLAVVLFVYWFKRSTVVAWFRGRRYRQWR